MKQLVIGILAHVDAGKTTLSEAMLYECGSIRSLGRVDKKDAFLDHHPLERNRGITIFSKQAVLSMKDFTVTLLDTPGHVDFSSEMERTLSVLDYAILVINGADGVQAHTRTLWQLLKQNQVPVFLFINKMDQEGVDSEALLRQLKEMLDEGCMDFGKRDTKDFYESIALCDEDGLERFLENESIDIGTIRKMIVERKLFPCFFGSALKLEGVKEFLLGMETYMAMPRYPEEFGARIFKIARDDAGNRLTYMKITGGSLKVKAVLGRAMEKVDQIRIYSGEKYMTVQEAEAGSICAVTGLSETKAGEGVGRENWAYAPFLEPVLTYRMELPPDVDPSQLLPKLEQLGEEQPELHILWDERLKEIQVRIMGEVQLEILRSLILERFHVDVEFGTGNIVYKETIADWAEGVGHYEPLRHYAEVHLLLEPLEPGSGLQFAVECSEELLDVNWQRLVLTHLKEKEHKGVLIGAPITDMRLTLTGGRAHAKHTEGGDFRQATYRAVRQGLMEVKSVLLEPYYEFCLEVPEKMVGRAMTDVERMCGRFDPFVLQGEMAVLTGAAPVAAMNGYQKEVSAYTKGLGRLSLRLKGYEPCHNQDEILEHAGYDPERDLENPSGSVFCSHGAGFLVKWDQVKEYRHVESRIERKREEKIPKRKAQSYHKQEAQIGPEEVDAILERACFANKKEKDTREKRRESITVKSSPAKKQEPKEEYLLVDGYNVIFAWEELKELAKVNIDSARGRLLDILCNYQGIKKCNLIVVFDAYRIKGHRTELGTYHNIHVVYTKEAETADQYIEKFAHENGAKYHITVATSDGLEQIIIRGEGCGLLSARELREEIRLANEKLCREYGEGQPRGRNRPFETLDMVLADGEP